MNHQIRFAIDVDILGDGYLQERFSVYVEILAQFVRHARRPASAARMAEMTAMPVAAMKRYLSELEGAGILEKPRGARDAWCLAKSPCAVTLEEVFRCAVAACASRRRGTTSRAVPAGGQEIELLLMQALQAVDDHLYKNLRTFSLDRLIASGAMSLPARRCRSMPPFGEVD